MLSNIKNAFLSGRTEKSKPKVTFPIVECQSLYDELPWDEYFADEMHISHIDGKSVMAGYVINQLNSGSFHTMARLGSLLGMLVPVEKKNPWILQWYINKTCLSSNTNSVSIRLVIYRRYCQSNPKVDTSVELSELCDGFDSAFSRLNIDAERMSGQTFYQWMATWLNPSIDGSQLINPWPFTDAPVSDDDGLYDVDVSDLILQSEHVVDDSSGIWYFNKMPFLYAQVESITGVSTKKINSLWENMPNNATCVLTMLFNDNRAKKILDKESSKDISDIPELHGITLEKLYQFHLGVYLFEANKASLEREINRLVSLLLAHGIKAYSPFKQDDKYKVGNVIRFLPGVFKYTASKFSAREARYLHASDLMCLLPLIRQRPQLEKDVTV